MLVIYYIHDGKEIHLQQSTQSVAVRCPAGAVLKPLLDKLMAKEVFGGGHPLFPLYQEGLILLPIKPGIPKEFVHSNLKAVRAFGLGPDVFETPDGSRLIPDGQVNARLEDRTPQQISALLKAYNATLVRGPSPLFPFHVLRPLDGDVFHLANTLATKEPSTLAQPRFESLLKMPPLGSASAGGVARPDSWMWGQARINAPKVWQEYTRGDPDIRVAVIDCGVDLLHPDLRDNLLPGFDAFDGDTKAQPFDDLANAHGTACAGIIVASGGNVTGVAPGCKLIPIRVGIIKNGFLSCGPEALAQAITRASELGADVINLSVTEASPTAAVHRAIDDVVHHPDKERRCVVVAAAGNDNREVRSPATHKDVIAVAAIDEQNKPWVLGAQGSNHGPAICIAAPGDDIWTTDISGVEGFSAAAGAGGNYTATFSGTSAACPFVAGVVALMLSINPELSPSQVREILKQTAVDIDPTKQWSGYFGHGLVDAFRAVRQAKALIGTA